MKKFCKVHLDNPNNEYPKGWTDCDDGLFWIKRGTVFTECPKCGSPLNDNDNPLSILKSKK